MYIWLARVPSIIIIDARLASRAFISTAFEMDCLEVSARILYALTIVDYTDRSRVIKWRFLSLSLSLSSFSLNTQIINDSIFLRKHWWNFGKLENGANLHFLPAYITKKNILQPSPRIVKKFFPKLLYFYFYFIIFPRLISKLTVVSSMTVKLNLTNFNWASLTIFFMLLVE